MLETDAPVVVDVYSKAWGACDMLNDKFTMLYFELAEDHGLKFVRAEVRRCAGHRGHDAAHCAEGSSTPHALRDSPTPQRSPIRSARLPT